MRPELLTPARRSAPEQSRTLGPGLLALALLSAGVFLLPGLVVPLAVAALFVALLVGAPLAAIRAWRVLSRIERRREVRARVRALLARPTP